MHVHVIRDNKEAKIWLQPHVELAHNHGFNPKEINDITKINKRKCRTAQATIRRTHR